MDAIFDLLDTCSTSEKTQLLKYSNIRNPDHSKKYKLLYLFIKEPRKKDSYYSKKIYQKDAHAAFFQLKKRVKDEIEDLLVFSCPLAQNESNQSHVACSKLLLKSELVLSRGLKTEGTKILERALKKAIQHEFHDLVLTVYHLAEKYRPIEVLTYKDLPELEIAIKSHLQLLINKPHADTFGDIKPSKNCHLDNMLSQLSKRKLSLSILDQITKSMKVNQFDESWSLIIEAEKSISDFNSIPNFHEDLTLAKMEILLAKRDFKTILSSCQSLSELSEVSTCGRLKIALYQWHALFHLERIEDSWNVLKNDLWKSNPEQSCKWKYFQAFIYFKQKSLTNSLKILHDCQQELKSFPDFFLGSKMLEIMILFDQEDVDWLDYKIDNLRKLISRYKGKVNTRISSGFQLVSKLQKNLYQTNHSELLKNEHFQSLSLDKGTHLWNPLGFELIRYDRWISYRLA